MKWKFPNCAGIYTHHIRLPGFAFVLFPIFVPLLALFFSPQLICKIIWRFVSVPRAEIYGNFHLEYLRAKNSTFHRCTRPVQKVSDLNFFRLNKSSTGSVHHCGCGGDIYAHAWISSRLQIASVAGSRSMIVYVLWALGGLSIIAKWRNELSSVIALNFAKSLAILKLKLFERFNRLSGTMSWVSHK